MPQRRIRTDSQAGRIREALGLTQEELALYLGVSRAQVAQVESGRSRFSLALDARLSALSAVLPPAAPADDETGPEPEPAGALDAKLLQARLDYCRHRARNLRYELKQLHRRMRALTRRRQALAWVRAGLLPASGQVAAHVLAGLKAAEVTVWFDYVEARTAVAAAPDVTQYALLRLRLRHYEQEVTELEQLLAGSSAAKE